MSNEQTPPAPSPADTKTQEAQNTATPNGARSSYVWPLFWGIFTLLAILILLAWILWQQRQIVEQKIIEDHALRQQIEVRNTALLAEVAALDALLAKEPCDILDILLLAQKNNGNIDGLSMPIILTAPIVYKEEKTAPKPATAAPTAAPTKKPEAQKDAGKKDINEKDAGEIAPPPPPIKKAPDSKAASSAGEHAPPPPPTTQKGKE